MATIACAGLSCATFDAFGFPQVSGMLFFAIGAVGALRRLGGLSSTEHGLDSVRLDPGFSTTALALSGSAPADPAGQRR